MTGISAAYYLSKEPRFEVSLFESNSGFGGLLGLLTVNGVGLEGYYHHLFKNDQDIIELVNELGMQDKLLYLPSKIGVFYDGKIYPFSGPTDLLTFTPLPLTDRLRLGLVALYLRNTKNWKSLRGHPAGEWMRRYAGKQAYKIVWKPLLRGKFGEHADKVSMAWLWHRLYNRGRSRSKSGKQEELVYFKGGFKVLVDRMVEEIKKNGGKTFTNTKINKISPTKQGIRLDLNNNNFKGLALEKCVVTVPNPIFVKMAPDLSTKIKKRLLKVKYRGAMVVVLQLAKQFMRDIYWLNIHNTSMQLLAVVEHTNFVSPRMYRGKHLLYAGNYPAQDDPIMRMKKRTLIKRIIDELNEINPAFNKSWVEKCWVFRDRYAQPIVTTDYYKHIPPVDTGIRNLYLVNMAQVYPEDRGTNQAVRDGRKIAERIAKRKNAAA